MYYSEHKEIFCGIFGHQQLPKYCGTESCRNLPFLSVLIAHTTQKAEQYSLEYFSTNGHIILNAKRYCVESFSTNSCRNIPFSCVLTACIKGKPTFSEIFRHQQLPEYSIFLCINCMYYTEGKPIFSEIFRH